eukprot:424862_1
MMPFTHQNINVLTFLNQKFQENILGYVCDLHDFNFKRCERRRGVGKDSSSTSISCLSYLELELDVFVFNNCISSSISLLSESVSSITSLLYCVVILFCVEIYLLLFLFSLSNLIHSFK